MWLGIIACEVVHTPVLASGLAAVYLGFLQMTVFVLYWLITCDVCTLQLQGWHPLLLADFIAYMSHL